MGRHRHVRTFSRWGEDWPTWPDQTRCSNCGSPEPVARWGAIPVCAACFDMWVRGSRYRRPMTENQRADMILDAWADAATGAQEEAY